MERPPASGTVFRRHRPRRRSAHGQSTPVPRADRIHDQPRGGPVCVLRRHLHRIAGADRREPSRRPRLCGARGSRGDARLHPAKPAVLRGSAERTGGYLRLAPAGREYGLHALLHVRHHGQPEGCAVQPPVAAAPRVRRYLSRRAGPVGAGQRAAGRAAVSRQCVGSALRRRHVRREARAARAAAGRGKPLRADEAGAVHLLRRRADRVARLSRLRANARRRNSICGISGCVA